MAASLSCHHEEDDLTVGLVGGDIELSLMNPHHPSLNSSGSGKCCWQLVLAAGAILVCAIAFLRKWPPIVQEDLGVVTTIVANPIIKPDTDEREYLGFRLANGLEVMVISQPNAHKVAAALSVGSGSIQDGDTLGLAHFCEHMLFLGSSEYPGEAEYSEFISAHGGMDNAYTSETVTNFFFDVESSALTEALKRFAGFFRSPLFSKQGAEREMLAVDSEFRKDLLNDDWRMQNLLKAQASSTHPYSRFSIGNLETLNRTDIHQVLLAYYSERYSARAMKLAVLGKEPTSALRAIVAELFSSVRSFEVAPQSLMGTPYPPNALGRILWAEGIQDQHELSMTWPVFPLQDRPRVNTLDFIGSLLGDEQDGSALAVLKSRGWGFDLKFGLAEQLADVNLVQLSVTLTADGLANAAKVLQLLFQSLSLVREAGLTEARWKEYRRLEEISFRFRKESEPADYVASLASAMQDVRVGPDLLSPPSRWLWDAKRADALLALLTPQNSIVILRSPLFIKPSSSEASRASIPPSEISSEWLDADPTQILLASKESWFATLYSSSKLGNELIESWSRLDAKLAGELTLPLANLFAPDAESGAFDQIPLQRHLPIVPVRLACVDSLDNLSSLDEVTTSASVATNAECDHAAELWWAPGEARFGPKVEVRCLLAEHNVYSSSAADAALAHLFIAAVDDELASSAYAAQLAGFHYSLTLSTEGAAVGFVLALSGYQGTDTSKPSPTKLTTWIDRVLHGMRSATQRSRFDCIKEKTRQAITNLMRGEPYQDAIAYHKLLTRFAQWSPDIMLLHLNNVTVEALDDYAQTLLPLAPRSPSSRASLGLQCIFNGNIRPQDSLRLGVRIVDGLGATLLPRASWPPQRFLQLDARPANRDGRWTHCSGVWNPDNSNSATLVQYFVGKDTLCPHAIPTTAAMAAHVSAEVVNHTCASDTAKLIILETLAKQRAFDQLRTKEQLGYIVFLMVMVDGKGDLGARWLTVLVESYTKDATYITERVHRFLTRLENQLSTISADEFAATKASVQANMLKKDVTLASATDRLFDEIISNSFRFKRNAEIAAAIDDLALEDVQAFYRSAVLGPKALSLEIQVFGKGRAVPENCNADSSAAFQAAQRWYDSSARGLVKGVEGR